MANSQWICGTDPLCICTGEPYSCDCQPGVGELAWKCLDCEAVLILIETNSGDPVAPHKFEQPIIATGRFCPSCAQPQESTIHVKAGEDVHG